MENDHERILKQQEEYVYQDSLDETDLRDLVPRAERTNYGKEVDLVDWLDRHRGRDSSGVSYF